MPERVNKKVNAMVYFHPWEFHANQPRLKVLARQSNHMPTGKKSAQESTTFAGFRLFL
jgi:hypothetical protein